VVDPVDPAEVVHRPPGDLSVDTEFVVQDRVRAYRAYAQFLMGHPQGRGELFADVAASRTGAVVDLAQVLGTDDRLPGPVDGADDRGRVDRQAAPCRPGP